MSKGQTHRPELCFKWKAAVCLQCRRWLSFPRLLARLPLLVMVMVMVRSFVFTTILKDAIQRRQSSRCTIIVHLLRIVNE